MKEAVAKKQDKAKAEFWTFLIKKTRDGKNGLWFVMITNPSLQSARVLPPVWRKIQGNGLPDNLGKFSSIPITGEIKLLGGEDAGGYEKQFIKRIQGKGFVRGYVPHGSFIGREDFFNIMLLSSFN